MSSTPHTLSFYEGLESVFNGSLELGARVSSILRKFLRAKYCQRAHPVAKKLDTGQSLIWNFMMRNNGIAETQIKWKINSGGTWNETMVRQWVPPLLVPKILSFPIHYQEQIPDEAIWKLTVDGLFSCSSAWEITRHKGTKSTINKGIWYRHLPFKISFLVWRALRNKLPTNEKITSFGKEAARCSCCYRTGEDNIDHIFVSGHFANNIWSFFSAAAGRQHDHIPINMLLRRWRHEHKSDVQNLLNQ
ncbi:hypothetical protein MTR67_039012 [Solanum verrucosum]|uniref:Reverse transcriptase zinc-binding domain-containing protein n=1 Tax=Solanum verrucosum TaxID=315347 RepID=A0AAF0UGL6_SOLVR|nr:hypothetical protein MTR67_039012 [Solanum verrucosum]